MKKIGQFASEVMALIYGEPIGLTAGEAFMLYKRRYPETNRSRNEVAKRISELKDKRLVAKKDTVTCCFSGRTVTEWGVTQKGVNYIKQCPNVFAVVAKTLTEPPQEARQYLLPPLETPEKYERLLRVDLTEREDKIRLSAYYRFLNRTQNGLPGDELSDWVEAEREYDECQLCIQRCLSLGYLVQVSV